VKRDDAGRLARRFESPFLRHYSRSKLAHDPLFAAVGERLRGHGAPLYDIGCGVGLMELWLREHGHSVPIRAIDHDAKKIAAARRLAIPDVEFETGDARDPIPPRTSVLLLDVLHYFSDADQSRILDNAAASAPLVIVRDAVRDGSWRYRATWAEESFARGVRWLRAERLNFPTRERIEAPFAGFSREVVPLWGKTPFNNYLFVFRRE
jgi:SAM-dependent methyltransferase